MIENHANRFICDLAAYEPGKPIEETARELGLDPADIIKLASNENPLGPSPAARRAMAEALADAHVYPDGAAHRLRSAIAAKLSCQVGQIVPGNGSNEIIELLCHVFLNRETELIAAEHAFVVYKLMATLFGARYVEVPDPDFTHDLDAMAAAVTERTRLIFITNPNNPTGTMVGQQAIDRFMEKVPDHVVVAFDEAYQEFPENAPDTLKFVRQGRNVCVLRTFSKLHGLAGLRIGYGVAPEPLAALLHKARQPFNANAIAQAGAIAALDDETHIAATREMNRRGLEFYARAFRERGLDFVPSHANFILVKTGRGARVFAEMLRRGVIIRAMDGYKLPDWVRITIGTPEQNQRCIATLDEVLRTVAEG